MRSAVLATLVVLVFISATPRLAHAEPGAQANFFCFWVDASRKQVATTALFRAEIARADEISSAFASTMRRDARRNRVYDCAWRRNPVQAEQDRQSLRAAHVSKGFAVSQVNWDPHIAER